MSIDYKSQYLKYKKKYLEAKKNKMSGGGLEIEKKLDGLLDSFKISENDFNKCIDNHIKNEDFTINNITTKANKHLLVVVYAHWCTHCVNFIKDFSENMTNHIDNENNGNIKFLDGVKLSDNWKIKLGINGFPTILKIDVATNSMDDLIKQEYIGDRSIGQLYEFITKKD